MSKLTEDWNEIDYITNEVSHPMDSQDRFMILEAMVNDSGIDQIEEWLHEIEENNALPFLVI